ncbi:38571_t:CDS:2, partial [Gigaspora margarita]
KVFLTDSFATIAAGGATHMTCKISGRSGRVTITNHNCYYKPVSLANSNFNNNFHVFGIFDGVASNFHRIGNIK